ncbi:hypothetical protein [Chondromyces crocatus]|nr:hypothetical protein [Chondromyces crocatus]
MSRSQHALFAPPLIVALAALSACSRTPAEPEAGPMASATTPVVPPLQWEAPGSWSAIEVVKNGYEKAAYKVPRAPSDKDDTEVRVMFFGTGSHGDVEKNFQTWLNQFEGKVGVGQQRSSFAVREMQVEMVELPGTYKVALAPPSRRLGKSPVEMVKENFRLLGAVVRTKDRGNWFFKVVGPDETVQATRETLRTLLQSAR